MPTAAINDPQCRIRLESERLIVLGPSEADAKKEVERRQIPLRDVERLVMVEGVGVSASALAALLRREIPVTLLGWNGAVLGSFLPPDKAHGSWRVRQYERQRDAGFSQTVGGRVVAAKIYNQRRVIQRMAANRKLDYAAGLERLERMLSGAPRCGSLDELRGHEGAASARYFELWATFLPEAHPFERRSRRPPHNAVNACLSFASTLIYHEMVSFIQAHGLDPALGHLHVTENGRWSLALDLMEPFRPVVAEALTLDLFSHQMLNADHFEPVEGGIYLNQPGRGKLLLQYERRMERQFLCEVLGHRTTLRQQLEAQVSLYKSSLESPDLFEPFLMN